MYTIRPQVHARALLWWMRHGTAMFLLLRVFGGAVPACSGCVLSATWSFSRQPLRPDIRWFCQRTVALPSSRTTLLLLYDSAVPKVLIVFYCLLRCRRCAGNIRVSSRAGGGFFSVPCYSSLHFAMLPASSDLGFGSICFFLLHACVYCVWHPILRWRAAFGLLCALPVSRSTNTIRCLLYASFSPSVRSCGHACGEDGLTTCSHLFILPWRRAVLPAW